MEKPKVGRSTTGSSAKEKVEVALSSSSEDESEMDEVEVLAQKTANDKEKEETEPEKDAAKSTREGNLTHDSPTKGSEPRKKSPNEKDPPAIVGELSSSTDEASDNDEKVKSKPSKAKALTEDSRPSRTKKTSTEETRKPKAGVELGKLVSKRVEKSKVDVDEDPIVNATTSNESNKAHFCAMCWGEDTEDKLLFQCRVCEVVYHNDCYRGVSLDVEELDGLQFESNENGLFVDTCYACAAVGTSVKGRTHKRMHHTLEVTARPYECCLCSVNDPSLPLPMHPVFDRNNGRHLVLERGPGAPKEIPLRRLAWCHTLCAQVISEYRETAGCVYACLRDGTYGGYEADDDDQSFGSDIEQARNEPKPGKPEIGADPEKILSQQGIHHFCIANLKKKDWEPFVKAIATRKGYRCVECLATINPKAEDWRMAIQCMCGEPQEPKRFFRCSGNQGHECLTAMHVGCAMWGGRINGKQTFPKVRRVYYEEVYGRENLCLLYCNDHAKLIRDKGDRFGIEGSDWLRFPGIPADKAFSVKGSKVKSQKVHIENENDVIESDQDESLGDDDRSYGEVETESGDEESESDLESDSNSDSGTPKLPEKKQSPRKKKKKRKDQKQRRKRHRGPKKEESARDRLTNKLNKKEKSSTGGGGGGTRMGSSGGLGGGGRSAQLSTGSTTQSQNKRSLESVATAGVEESRSQEIEEESKKPKKPRPKKESFFKNFLIKNKDILNSTE